MEYKIKYALGDVLFVKDYYDELFVGIVTEIKINNNNNGQPTVYYLLKIGSNSNYATEVTDCENYFNICGKVGNIDKLYVE